MEWVLHKKEGFCKQKMVWRGPEKIQTPNTNYRKYSWEEKQHKQSLDVERYVLLLDMYVNSTKLKDKFAKVSWDKTAEVFKCHAKDPDVVRIFPWSSSPKRTWLVHIPALPSLFHICWTLLILGTLCAFYLFQEKTAVFTFSFPLPETIFFFDWRTPAWL